MDLDIKAIRLLEENARQGLYIDLLLQALRENKLEVFDFIKKHQEDNHDRDTR